MSTRRAGPLFSISAFEALRRLRLLRLDAEQADLPELAALILRTEPDAAGLDFDSSFVLHSVVPRGASLSVSSDFYRDCAFHALIRSDLSWSRAITLGRRRFHDLLDRDERQCLREAHLMEDHPDDSVIEWWDRATEHIRTLVDGQKHYRGRSAERLSMAFETDRLSRLGVRELPRWIAIDVNTAGYDILSYEPNVERLQEPVPLLIEVKSSVASPLRFYVTRNEWKKAVEYGASYLFHIWDLTADSPRLHTRAVKQVYPHIPADQNSGQWSTAIIPLAAQ